MVSDAPILPPVLEVFKLSKRFRGLLALQDVDLNLLPGIIHGVIGPNGAGKTTLFNCLTGQIIRHRRHKSSSKARTSPAACARHRQLGIARTFQNIRLFGSHDGTG